MNVHYSIMVEPASDLVRIDMGGFFSAADVGAFRQLLEREMRALRCRPNEHFTLCDVTAMNIQPQEIVGAFSQIVGNSTFRSKRLAFVTGSSLARLQTRRLTDREGVEFFTDKAEAEAWLLPPGEMMA